MPSHSIRARAARGDRSASTTYRDPDLVARYLSDAAHAPGGYADGVEMPASEAQVAAVLRSARSVLAIGSQSSLTGGATPRGETVVSTARLDAIKAVGGDSIRVGAGVTLDTLESALSRVGCSYPPTPTFTGASVGGVVATNAAGAATFKHGSTRPWVRALSVVLPGGEVLDIERGETLAHPAGYFEFVFPDRRVRVPVPSYRMPNVPKISAGYFAAPRMDLIDLFIGSEGTLGVVTEVSLRVLRDRPAICRTFVPLKTREIAFSLAGDLRRAAAEAWSSGGKRGVDVAAIEHIDARGLALLREDRLDRIHGIPIPADAQMALAITIELPHGTAASDAFEQLGRASDADAPDTPLVRFSALLAAAGAADDVAIAVPGDAARHAQVIGLREALPVAVNARIRRAQATVDGRIEKTAGDLLVPFDQLPGFIDTCEKEMESRGLESASWGHLSDGNVHPNVLPRSYDDVVAGRAALLSLGREAIRLGGVPLAEHGVGRSAVKQQMLIDLYGTEGIEQMRRVKQAIDPDFKLAPGVIFPG